MSIQKEKVLGTRVVNSANANTTDNSALAVKDAVGKVVGFTTLFASADDNSSRSMNAFNALSSKMRSFEDGDDDGLEMGADGWATMEGVVEYPDGTTEAFTVRLQMLDADGNPILSEAEAKLAAKKAHIILTTPTLSFDTVVELFVEPFGFGVIYSSYLSFVHTDGYTYTATMKDIVYEDVVGSVSLFLLIKICN